LLAVPNIVDQKNGLKERIHCMQWLSQVGHVFQEVFSSSWQKDKKAEETIREDR
jgi:hypothetical protein